MTSAEVTRRELTLGATRDTTTGHPPKVFAETTIDAIIVHNGVSPVNLPIGMYARWEHTAFIPDVIHLGDEIIDAQGKYYLVKAVQELWWLDQFDGYICNLSLIDEHFDRAATSGTWHLDSEAATTDNRYRNKLYLQTYITASHLKLDNASTNASYVVMFSGADYPLKYEFSPSYNDVDLIFAVDKGNSVPMYDAYRDPYGTEEEVIVRTFAINKTGLTAINLLDQAYAELKEVFSDITHNASGTFRGITRTALKPEDLGGMTLYSEEITIRYERPNDDYTPTIPKITYSSAGAGPYDYIMPNCIELTINGTSPDQYNHPLSYIGDSAFFAGDNSLEITLKGNLDIEPPLLSWKRGAGNSQAVSPTDKTPYQVWLDIKHNQAITDDYFLLDLGWGSTIKARLITVIPKESSDENTITVVLKEYREDSADDETYKVRFGIT